MSFVTVVYTLLYYLAAVVLAFGLGYKIVQFARTPAPTTPSGVWFRMGREVVLFESLFRSNKWIWLFGWMFHVGLALVVVRHLRYLIPIPGALAHLMPIIGIVGGLLMLVGLLGLLARRLLVPRIRYITRPGDRAILGLLILIGLSGFAMTFWSHTDIVQVKAFLLGLLFFNWQPLPTDPALLVHLLLVAVLAIIFPFSKLLHAPGVFFSPTRNQVDNPREQRHLAPWAAPLDGRRAE